MERMRDREKHSESERRAHVDSKREWLGQHNGRENKREDKHMDSTEWQVIRRRKIERVRKTTDVARNYQFYLKDAPRSTFFFTNFSDNFHAKHMLKAFFKYGDFEEVVITTKRDKIGSFDFARAVNAKNQKGLQ